MNHLPGLDPGTDRGKAASYGSRPTGNSAWRRFWSRIRRLRALFRLMPFDVSNEEGRAQERHRRALLSSATGVLSRIVSLVTPLVTIPLTLSYLGTERYGVWMTISSVVASLAFADLGIGNGLLNSVSAAYGRDDKALAREYVSSGFFLLLAIALILATGYFAAYPFLPWQKLFGISSPAVAAEVPRAVTVFVACFLLSFPLGTIDRTLMAYQEAFRTAFWAPFASLLSLLFVVVAIKQNLGIAGLIFAISGTSVLISMANGVFLFKFNRPWLLPRPSLITKSAASRILKLGGMFFVIQLAAMVRSNSGNMVIAHTLGSSAVTQYAVPVRVLVIVGSLITIMLTPIWPAYSEAIARGDVDWVRTTLKRSTALSLVLTIPFGAFLILFGRVILFHWTGGRVVPSTTLLIALAIWGIVSGVWACFAIFLMAAAIRFHACTTVMASVLNLFLSIYFTGRIGISGAVLSSIIGESLGVTLTVIYVPRVLRSLTAAHRR